MKSACFVPLLVFAIAAVPTLADDVSGNPIVAQLKTPYPANGILKGLQLDWSTHRRDAPGSDNFQLTWADDDHLYGAWGDGGGFGGTNGRGRVGLGVARIEGSPDNYHGVNVWGGANAVNPATFDGKSWGMICIDGILDMWVVPDVPDKMSHRNHYEYIELARSRDHGATWTKARWKFLQSESLTVPTLLNFGKDGCGVPRSIAGYVYSYFIRPQSKTMHHQGPDGVGLIVHKPGAIYLARVLCDLRFERKTDYQFFTGCAPNGEPRWGPLADKQPVFEDPNGVGWCLSACYLPNLKRIILCTEHGASRQGMIGIFEAPTPWGPWSTVEYYQPEHPFGAARPGSELSWKNNIFFAAFPTKWLSGTEFTMNFTGAGRGQDNDSFNTISGRFQLRAP